MKFPIGYPQMHSICAGMTSPPTTATSRAGRFRIKSLLVGSVCMCHGDGHGIQDKLNGASS